MFLGVKK